MSHTTSWPHYDEKTIFNRTAKGRSNSPQSLAFEEKAADVVGLYLDPLMDAVVLSINEKTREIHAVLDNLSTHSGSDVDK